MNQLPTTEAFGHAPHEVAAQAGVPDTEQLPAAPRRLQPLHLALAGGLVVLVGGGAFWLTRSGGEEVSTVSRPVASRSAAATPGVSSSPMPSLQPVGLAPTRNPFVGPTTAGASSSGSTTGTGSGGGGSTTTVTATATEQVTSTVTATRTTTATTTATVTASPTYVFLSTWSLPEVELVVNDSVPTALAAGESAYGVTYVEQSIDDPNCAMVKKAGADDSTKVSVCLGESIELG